MKRFTEVDFLDVNWRMRNLNILGEIKPGLIYWKPLKLKIHDFKKLKKKRYLSNWFLEVEL